MTQLKRRILMKIVLPVTLVTAATAAVTIYPFAGLREQCLDMCLAIARTCFASGNQSVCLPAHNSCVSRYPAQ
jgi:hypothetical protein